MEIAKAEGKYTTESMQKMATIASTADGLNIEGNNFKVCALTGSPDMVLFACERIKELEAKLREVASLRDSGADTGEAIDWLLNNTDEIKTLLEKE